MQCSLKRKEGKVGPGPEMRQNGSQNYRFWQLKMDPKFVFHPLAMATIPFAGTGDPPVRNGYHPSCQNWCYPFVIALVRSQGRAPLRWDPPILALRLGNRNWGMCIGNCKSEHRK